MCGDAHDEATYDAVLDGELVEAVFTDPPYNVPIQGHVGGRGRVRHDEFLVASGELDSETFAGFLRDAFAQAAAHSVDGSLHYICMDWRHIGEMLSAGRAVYQELNNLCVWNKSNAGMGSFYRSKHELVFVWKRGTAPHINNVQLGSYGRSRTNVWDYPGANAFGADRMRELAMHPTVKPTALIADALKDCTRRNGLVLDSFAGSGSTIIAAEMTGRRARAIELDPRYVDVAVRRWQAWSGKAAVLCADGRSFESVEEERAAKAAAA
jgi:DNA modification methylase